MKVVEKRRYRGNVRGVCRLARFAIESLGEVFDNVDACRQEGR